VKVTAGEVIVSVGVSAPVTVAVPSWALPS
jgi:hypothetical protein